LYGGGYVGGAKCGCTGSDMTLEKYYGSIGNAYCVTYKYSSNANPFVIILLGALGRLKVKCKPENSIRMIWEFLAAAGGIKLLDILLLSCLMSRMAVHNRSEERRVGKECRSWWSELKSK